VEFRTREAAFVGESSAVRFSSVAALNGAL